MKRNLRLEMKIWGSILDCQVILEKTQNIGLWIYDMENGYYYKELPNYPVDGDLDVKTIGFGLDGSEVTLTIKIDGEKHTVIKDTIVNGHFETNKQINLTNKL